jgi:hypothetical protein
MRLSVILMEQAAEPVSPVHTALISCDGGRTDPWIRRFQPEGPVDVVVFDVGLKHLLEVSSPDDQQPVQALGPHRADPAFGVGVGVGCLHRRDQHVRCINAFMQLVDGIRGGVRRVGRVDAPCLAGRRGRR